MSKSAAKIALLKFNIEQEDQMILRCMKIVQAFENTSCNKLNEVIKGEERQQ